MRRRSFVKYSGKVLMSVAAVGCGTKNSNQDTTEDRQEIEQSPYDLSLAQWSLHRTLNDGKLDHLDFISKTKNDFGIHAVEYVNQFFKDKAKDKTYLNEMNKRASDHDVKQLLIMIDGEGGLGDPNDTKRNEAVENHYKWVEAAKHLGCHSIRVNAFGVGSREDVFQAAVDGLGSLSTFAKDYNINVLVENHGGYSSDGKWLSGVMQQINMNNCGTLPDFGNFCVKRDSGKEWDGSCIEEYDRYQGVRELMPFAKAVSAKSHDFNEEGQEIHTDYFKMMDIVKSAGYTGYVGIEYEGSNLSEDEGILATKQLLKQTFETIQ